MLMAEYDARFKRTKQSLNQSLFWNYEKKQLQSNTVFIKGAHTFRQIISYYRTEGVA